MLDRASTFADPEIVKMLQDKFVPVAIDQWFQRQQDDAEGRFYQGIAKQGPRTDPDSTTQGFYIATASGKLLYYNNNRGPARIRSLMKNVLAKKTEWAAKPIRQTESDARFPAGIPDGAIVVQVNSKVLDGYSKPSNPWKALMHKAVGRDNLWIMPTEKTALLENNFPNSLAEKILRFYLVDNTRGEPPMWSASDIKKMLIDMDDLGMISGSVELESADQGRAYKADLFGRLETGDGKIVRFDLVFKGDFQGEGQWTRGAPRGEFPFAVAFRLAKESDIAFAVLPQAIKAYGNGYLDFGRE